jgi:hypothetical protein
MINNEIQIMFLDFRNTLMSEYLTFLINKGKINVKKKQYK